VEPMIKLDGLPAYLEECCRKYDLKACAVVTTSGKVLDNAGDFIPDACLSSLPKWLEMSHAIGQSSGMKASSSVCLSSANQREHMLAWRFEAWDDLNLCVLLYLNKIPRHTLFIQHAMTRDIPTLMMPVQGLDT